ncbi:hypothetical protein NESM_000136900 [Novymonas esmeraldas]|uniref:Uncharacterized protein n=1 Tax=Novymonas esmeraldas TaxID=1808958 RepID=A0AAW0F5S7_9TRYP
MPAWPTNATLMQSAPSLVVAECAGAQETHSPSPLSVEEASPEPPSWVHSSASASRSPATHTLDNDDDHHHHHHHYSMRKTFARSAAPPTPVAAPARAATTTLVATPVAGWRDAAAPSLSTPPPSSLRGIVDFYLGSSPPPRRPQDTVATATAAARVTETGDGRERSGSLDSSEASELFRRSAAPDRAYIEDFLAMSDDDDDDADATPVEHPRSPSIRADSRLRGVTDIGSVSPAPHVVRVALNHSPVVPEMWDETSSSSATSTVSDGFDKGRDMPQQRHLSRFENSLRLSSASPHSPHPVTLTAAPARWRDGRAEVDYSNPSRAGRPLSTSPTAPLQHATNAKLSDAAPQLRHDTHHRHHRHWGNGDSERVVERVLLFPADASPEQESAAAASRASTEEPRVPPNTTPSLSLTLRDVVAGDQDGQKSAWQESNGSGGGGEQAVSAGSREPRHEATPHTAPVVHGASLSWRATLLAPPPTQTACGGALETLIQHRPGPHMPRHQRVCEAAAPQVEVGRSGSIVASRCDAAEVHRTAAKRASVRALLSRLHPPPPTTSGDASALPGSHFASDARRPRWSLSAKVRYHPVTESIEQAPVDDESHRAEDTERRRHRSLSRDGRRSASATPKAPLHTRTSLLRLEATKARQAQERLLLAEAESPSFCPTVAPRSARICREKQRELAATAAATVNTAATVVASAEARGSAVVDFWDDAAEVVADVSVSSSDESAAAPVSAAPIRRLPESSTVTAKAMARAVASPRQERARQAAAWSHPRAHTKEVGSTSSGTLSSPTGGVAVDAAVQCDLLPAASDATAAHSRSPATPAPAGDVALSTPTAATARQATPQQQRVDLYDSEPDIAPDVRVVASARQLRVEDRLLALEADRRRRLAALRHRESIRDPASGQLLFTPFTGR